MTARIIHAAGSDRVRLAPMRADLGIGIGLCQGVEPALAWRRSKLSATSRVVVGDPLTSERPFAAAIAPLMSPRNGEATPGPAATVQSRRDGLRKD
jgi:hypothetical protein